jgi:hypothetical protein
MRSSFWISLLRRLPEQYHAKLILIFASGHEINLSSIFRMEEDYMIIRGRLAGSTDAGTFVFVPFDQIVYIGFREEIKEAEMEKIWGEAPPAPVAAAPPAEAPVPESRPTPEPTPMPAASPAAAAAGAAPVPGKATLLERLRRGREKTP